MNVIIFDIDGVIANNDHRQHLEPVVKNKTENWHSWNREAFNDTQITPMCNVVRGFIDNSYVNVVFLTSRCENGRFETVEWLRANVHPKIREEQLIMRMDGDDRHDYEIKAEFCLKLIETGVTILNVFEDSFITVHYLLSNGIPATLVADPGQLPSNVSSTGEKSYRVNPSLLQ